MKRALAIGGTATGLVAVDARDDLSRVSAALLITTGVSALASAYFTYRMFAAPRYEQPPTPPTRSCDVAVGPTGMTAFGTFQ